MSKQQIAKLEQQLKVLPPGSAAAKALRAAIMQAQATLKAAAPPPAPQELAPSVIPEIIPAIPPSIVSTATGLSPVPAPPLTSVEIPETPVVMPSTTPEKPHIYQAVGIIQAELQRNETGRYCLQWREKTWPVRPLQRMWKILPQRLDQLLYWRVYPQSYLTEQGFIVDHFAIVGQPIAPKLGDGQFHLGGCWQSLDAWQNKAMPDRYFSVYRNPTPAMPVKHQYYQNYTANHWNEPPVTPTRRHPTPWHLILAELQVDGCFDFRQLLDGPKPAPARVKRPTDQPIQPSRIMPSPALQI
jgi:hypothetical protein